MLITFFQIIKTSWNFRGIAKFRAEGKVDNELAVKAEFSLVLPNEIKKYI